MRKPVFLFFVVMILFQLPVNEALASPVAPVGTEFHAAKKKNKGYKKPRKKKFLGIFKRKSSCDCPKH